MSIIRCSWKSKSKTRGSRVRPTVSATGLSINFAGTSSRTQILNFQASSITTFTYIVTPTKEGVFEIPSIEVSAGGKVYRTSSSDPQGRS